ncbi:MAG TPA: DUF1003 domain-containing protein [Candidatus Saccharimonadales bacterium]
MNTPFNWHKAHKASLSRGDRAADKLRNGMGSWAFVFSFLVFMGIWAAFNTLAAFHNWDEYPFILLNLFLSMLAGLQGAILLIAAKRQDGISAAMAQHDYDTNTEAKKEIERLMDLNEQQLKLIQELHKEAKERRH